MIEVLENAAGRGKQTETRWLYLLGARPSVRGRGTGSGLVRTCSCCSSGACASGSPWGLGPVAPAAPPPVPTHGIQAPGPAPWVSSWLLQTPQRGRGPRGMWAPPGSRISASGTGPIGFDVDAPLPCLQAATRPLAPRGDRWGGPGNTHTRLYPQRVPGTVRNRTETGGVCGQGGEGQSLRPAGQRPRPRPEPLPPLVPQHGHPAGVPVGSPFETRWEPLWGTEGVT